MKKILLAIMFILVAASFVYAEDSQPSEESHQKLVPAETSSSNENLINVDYTTNRMNMLERRMDSMERSIRELRDEVRDTQRDLSDLRRRRL